jgi:hypothetical protein
MIHTAQETIRCGPLNLLAQWALENTIGNLGREVRQPSNAFSNLAERGLLRARQNALLAIIPELDSGNHFPRGALQLGDGYCLLRAAERNECTVQVDAEASIIRTTLKLPQRSAVLARKWARLLLPNQQIARSLWRDGRAENGRISRNVKVIILLAQSNFILTDSTAQKPGQCIHRFGRSPNYFTSSFSTPSQAFAMIKTYSNPDPDLLSQSHNALWVSRHLGTHGLRIVDAKSIGSVIAMVPFVLREEEVNSPQLFQRYNGCVCMVEKPFLASASTNEWLEELHGDEEIVDN